MSTHAFQPEPAGWSLADRLAWAGRFARLLGEHEGPLCDLAEAEVHKPRWECITAELVPLINACRWHRRHAARVLADRGLPGSGLLTMGQRHRVVRAPIGRVGIIATWNYPILLAGQHVLQALIAGNRVVLKPSEHTPRTQALLGDLVRRAGVPDGYLEVTDADRAAGARLVAGDFGAMDHVVFTGSTEVGRSIASELAPRLITSTLELSGRDSALVLDDADPALAARSVWWGATTNAGQTCMAPRRALVHTAVYDRFLKALAPLASRAEPRQLIDAPAAAKVSDLAAGAIRLGGRSVSGVFEPASLGRFRPVAVVDCPPDAPLVEGRHFGPAMAVVRCDSLDAMLAVHGACDQHLSTSVFTSKRRRADELACRLGSTGLTINDTIIPTAHPGTSLGGVGASGWGLTQGRAGLEGMTRPVFVSRTSRLIRPPLDTPDPTKHDRAVGVLLRLAGAGQRTTIPGEGTASRPHESGREPGADPSDRAGGVLR